MDISPLCHSPLWDKQWKGQEKQRSCFPSSLKHQAAAAPSLSWTCVSSLFEEMWAGGECVERPSRQFIGHSHPTERCGHAGMCQPWGQQCQPALCTFRQ